MSIARQPQSKIISAHEVRVGMILLSADKRKAIVENIIINVDKTTINLRYVDTGEIDFEVFYKDQEVDVEIEDGEIDWIGETMRERYHRGY